MDEKYREGVCEICENFAQLHEHDGKWICDECADQKNEELLDDETA